MNLECTIISLTVKSHSSPLVATSKFTLKYERTNDCLVYYIFIYKICVSLIADAMVGWLP